MMLVLCCVDLGFAALCRGFAAGCGLRLWVGWCGVLVILFVKCSVGCVLICWFG